MTITALPTAPTRDDPINFATQANTWVAALGTFTTEVNATAVAMQTNADVAASAAAALALPGYSGSSTTSTTIGTGSKTFTTQSGKLWAVGMAVVIAADANNYMKGIVTSYSSTTLIVNVTFTGGSGTFNSWTISPTSITMVCDSDIKVKGTITVGSGNNSNTNNTSIGLSAGSSISSGGSNVFAGSNSGSANTTGSNNVAVGSFSLSTSSTASNNVAVGSSALQSNTSGTGNVAVGYQSLSAITGGINNIAIGFQSGSFITTGSSNTIVGSQALFAVNNNGGITAVGFQALNSSTGARNTAVGYVAGGFATNTGADNTLVGYTAGTSISSGARNSIIGSIVGAALTTATDCTLIGCSTATTLTSGSSNTVVGSQSATGITTAVNNTVVGVGSFQNHTTGGSNVVVGANSFNASQTGANLAGNSSNTVVGYGALNMASTATTAVTYCEAFGYGAGTITGTTSVNGVTFIGSNCTAYTGNNQVLLGNSLTTVYYYAIASRSDERDKADIKPTELGLDFITKLRPVDYRWDMREDYRPERPVQGDKTDEQYQAELLQWSETCDFSKITRDGSKKRNRFHQGFIAQEVKDAMAAAGVDFGGFQDHTVNGGQDVMTLGYTEFIAPIVRAIQELTARLEALEGAK